MENMCPSDTYFWHVISGFAWMGWWAKKIENLLCCRIVSLSVRVMWSSFVVSSSSSLSRIVRKLKLKINFKFLCSSGKENTGSLVLWMFVAFAGGISWPEVKWEHSDRSNRRLNRLRVCFGKWQGLFFSFGREKWFLKNSDWDLQFLGLQVF